MPACALRARKSAANFNAAKVVRSLRDLELSARLAYVSYWGYSGKHMLGVRFSQYDPTETWPRPAAIFRIRVLVLSKNSL
jgi:hypothetical protein